MKALTSKSICSAALVTLLSGCDSVTPAQLFNSYTSVDIFKGECTDCIEPTFRESGDISGTLDSALTAIKAELALLTGEYTVVTIHGYGVDMNGNIPTGGLFEYNNIQILGIISATYRVVPGLWSVEVISESDLTRYEYTYEMDGTVSVNAETYLHINEMLDDIDTSERMGLTPLNMSKAEFLATDFADSSTLMTTIMASEGYTPSGFSLDHTFRGLGANDYLDPSVEPGASNDVGHILFHAGGIKVVIPNENDWVIEDFADDETTYFFSGLVKSEWELDHYGKVNRAVYEAGLQTYSFDVDGSNFAIVE